MPKTATVAFKDGSSHVYEDVPDDIPESDIYARASQEFKKPIAKIVGMSSGKRPPAAIATLEGDDLSAIQGAQGINKDLDSYKKLMDEGRLVLGPYANTMGHIGNYLGMSTESSRNLASFESALQRLRNASLRLNKGVQTEGDAQRAWDELINSLNDVNLVKQRIDEIKAYNGRASDQKRTQVDMRREMYGIDPVEWGKVIPQPTTVGQPLQRRQPAPGPRKSGRFIIEQVGD